MFSQIILFSVLSFSSPDACTQLDCDDATRLSEAAMANLSKIRNNLLRMRELGIQASNGAIGNKERAFLDDELEAWLDETFRIIYSASFVDIFQKQYFYLSDGIQFKTPIKIKGGNFAYLQDFVFEPLRERQIGQLAREVFKLKDPEENFINQFSLSLNGIEVQGYASDDHLSTDGAGISAIAFGAAVNSKSGLTGIHARLHETEVLLNNIDFENYETIKSGDLRINGVEVVGSVRTPIDFVQLVHDFSSSTGVKARTMAGSWDDVQLFATDGRNIVIEAAEALAEVLNIEGFDGSKKIFTGAVELISGEEMKIDFNPSYHGYLHPALQRFDEIDSFIVPLNDSGLYTIDISTQSSAQDSLMYIDQSLSQLNRRMVQANLPALLCNQ